MLHGMPNMSKTSSEVRNDLRREGKTVEEWSKENGFAKRSVQAVLNGHNKGYRGQSHKIALALGLKDKAL